MRAILLAAGFGTRLRPLTTHTPKCLVSINKRPLLERWLEQLDQADIGPVLVNTHYLSEQVQDYLKNSPYRDNVSWVYEEQLLGTASTLIQNIDFYQEKSGLLIHADNYCLADLSKFIRAHKQRPPDCLMTMMTFETDNPSSCGIVALDKRGVVVRFHEKIKNPPGNLANGAVYILSKSLLKILRKRFSSAVDFSTEVLPQLMGKIYTYQTDQILIDIGTPKMYEKANMIAKAER